MQAAIIRTMYAELDGMRVYGCQCTSCGAVRVLQAPVSDWDRIALTASTYLEFHAAACCLAIKKTKPMVP